MRISRRSFIAAGLAAGSAALARPQALRAQAARPRARFKIGVPDWSLGQSARPDAIALAARIGFEGIQISLGTDVSSGQLPLGDPARQQTYRDAAKQAGIAIASCRVEMLHKYALSSRDPLLPTWIAQSVPIAKAMGFEVILLPFFGDGAIRTPGDMDYVGDFLREIAPEAQKAGVVFGLEDTLSAEDNVRIMERSRSPAVLTYYDVGNSTDNGFDIIEEIRWLGRERICEVHIKDNPNYLGEGKIDLPAVIAALTGIGFDKWAQLETSNPTKNVEADMGRNLAFIRKLMNQA